MQYLLQFIKRLKKLLLSEIKGRALKKQMENSFIKYFPTVPKPPLDIGGNIVVAKFDCIGDRENQRGHKRTQRHFAGICAMLRKIGNVKVDYAKHSGREKFEKLLVL